MTPNHSGADRYLTTGQVAQLTGVSRGTILRAVRQGTLTPALQLPGGALRFIPAEVDSFVRALNLKSERHRNRSLPVRPPPSSDAERVSEVQEGIEFLPEVHASTGPVPADSNILAVIADSLHAGAVFVARMGADTWWVDELADRMGMGLRVGDRAPFASWYGMMLVPDQQTSLICEDVQHDTRFADLAASHPSIGSIICVPLILGDGRVYGALGVVRPFAASVQSHEVALLRLVGQIVAPAAHTNIAHRNLRAIWDASPDAMVVSDPEGIVLATNASYHRLVGYSPRDVIGRHFSVLFPTREQRELSDEYQRLFRQAAAFPRLETTVTGADGTARAVELSVSFLAYDEHPRAMLSIARDITARKQAEQLAQASLDALAARLVVLDQDGVIRTVNHAWLRFADSRGLAREVARPGANYLTLCEHAGWMEARDRAAFTSGVAAVLAGAQTDFVLTSFYRSPTEEQAIVARATRIVVEGTARVIISHEDLAPRR